MIMNYDQMIQENNIKEDGRDVMLAIMPDAFYATFKPYAEWKTRAGIQTFMTKFSEIGANADNPQIIRDYIKKAYQEWEYPPTYVLLVGDYGTCPVKYEIYPDYTLMDEDYFGKVDGDDFFPEIMVGRMPSKEVSTLDLLVSKAMKYEKTPYMKNTDWFKHAVVCSNNLYASQVETKRYTRDIMLNDGGFTKVDSLWSDGSSHGGWGQNSDCTVGIDDITSSLSEGRSFLNYRGEAWTDGWSTLCYEFTNDDVSSVTNGEMLTFVTNIGCGVNKFDYDKGNCFGETWLKLGTKAKPRGACAFIGPTSNSHTAYNNKIDRGIYVGLFQEGLRTAAQSLLRGKLMMNESFGSDDHWVKYQFELFCVLGDPSLQIWKDVPRYVNVAKPEFVPVGYSQAEFIVTDKTNNQPMKKAQVCLSGDGVFYYGETDENGKILFSISTAKEMYVNLTVRGTNVYPVLDSIQVKNKDLHLAPFGTNVIIDNAGNNNGLINPNEKCKIKIAIKNYGTTNASGVKAILKLENETYASMSNSSSIDLGTINSNSEAVNCEFEFTTKDNCPTELVLPFALEITSGQSEFKYKLTEKVAACNINYKSVEIDELNDYNNTRLDPGETANLLITVNNFGRDEAKNLKATLSCTYPNITILTAESSVGSVAARSDNSNSKFNFKISVSSNTPLDTNIELRIKYQTQNADYPYSKEDTFSISIGQPMRTDPTGPDAYGYYIYANTDTVYQQSPKYQWTDISSVGSTLSSLNNINDVQSLSLPFTFKYYGKNYSKIAVSSCGWFTFSTTYSEDYGNTNNVRLPSSDATPLMVAASWAYYSFESDGTSGTVISYYYDQSNHRFIIQWKNLLNYNYTSETKSYDTFQAILLDENYYNTESGNGEIIIQYNTLHEISSNTVGFQDETSANGMSYIHNGNFTKTANILEDETALKITTEKPNGISSVEQIDNAKYNAQVIPNPSKGNSVISLNNLPEGNIKVNIFAETGDLVNTIDYGYNSNEQLNIQWNAINANGNSLPNGIYIGTIYLNNSIIANVKFVLSK